MHPTVLEGLWKQSQNPITGQAATENWNSQIETLYRLGISMEDTLQYLYSKKPSFEEFKAWVNTNTKIAQESILNENVFSGADLQFWNENGYVIVRNAITKEHCEDTAQAIWDFLNMSPNDEASWYKNHEAQKGLMVSFSNHETLNRNRLSPRIKKAYEQLYQSTDIYKTIDKVSFNPPENGHYTFMGSALHWDTSLVSPIPFALQGLLYLTDCGPHDGAFHCVPGFHNRIEGWLEQAGENPRDKALATLKSVPITADAGDFIIWDNRLPHCASANHGTTPRMVQYLTYLPADYKAAEKWL